jgi:lipopolysaccharide/colanic/teichoic acid biosynthesis glycosyltransferase
MKTLFDFIFASIGFIFLLPVALIVALIIKMDSAGPVFYRGIRTGKHGRPFRIFKFRTMVVDAEKLGGPSTGKDDPRVTRVGRFLRAHKIDEIPQLLNVLTGEMSIVGPRPEVPQYTSLYEGDEKLILSVKPGITDLASIKFSRLDEHLGSGDPDSVYEEKIRPVKNRLRVQYVKERTFLGDLGIIIQTLKRVFYR